ncbi:MAG: dimethylsulfonioproprionate lyase family protein [Pseudomonadota bacterium]
MDQHDDGTGETTADTVSPQPVLDVQDYNEPDYSRAETAVEEPMGATQETLLDHPDWGYLLQEVRYLYANLPAGGSEVIRRHMRIVADHVNKAVRSNAPVLSHSAQEKPVSRHLSRALDNGEASIMASTTRALSKLSAQLYWQYGYDKMPKSLEKKYAYAEIMGPRGPVKYDDLIVGLVLFAPRTVYPQHAHKGIMESYICLSGAVSENDAGVYPPGALILNQPQAHHRITTQDREPALLLYAWAGSRDALSGEEMKFTKKSRK